MPFNNEERQAYWRKERGKAFEALGEECFICKKRNKTFVFHAKDGKGHGNSSTAHLVLKNPNAFVVLCRHPCHANVHWCMKYFNLTWKEIMGRLV